MVLRDASYNGIKDVKECKVRNTPQHEAFITEANKRIERNRIQYARAYRNAGSYLAE